MLNPCSMGLDFLQIIINYSIMSYMKIVLRKQTMRNDLLTPFSVKEQTWQQSLSAYFYPNNFFRIFSIWSGRFLDWLLLSTYYKYFSYNVLFFWLPESILRPFLSTLIRLSSHFLMISSTCLRLIWFRAGLCSAAFCSCLSRKRKTIGESIQTVQKILKFFS